MTTATGSRSELMTAIRGLSAARDLPPEVIIDALKAALVSAYHKIPGGTASNVTVDIDEQTGESRVYSHFTVVEEQYLEDPHGEITVAEARAQKADATIGDIITHDVTPDDFGRIAAQTAKQVILQRIREAEREQTYTTYADREGEIVYGTIQTANRDSVTVALDRVEALLPKGGQIPGERYSPNQRIRVYVSEVKRSPKGPQVIVSRTHREMLKRLMELEIPEVFQGAVEIKAIAREAGSRSKVAVWAHQEGVDPVGACVGMRGVRIQALVRELGGEKIDIVEWDPDPRVFIAHALSPAKVVHVWLEEESERRTANVIVPDSQLSLAIGREGQNARLAAKLTGWRIDIRAESEAGDVLEKLRVDDATRAAERARQAAVAAEAAAAAVAGTEPEETPEIEPELVPAAEAEPAVADVAEVTADAEPEPSMEEEEATVEATVEIEAEAEEVPAEPDEPAPVEVVPEPAAPEAVEVPEVKAPPAWSADPEEDAPETPAPSSTPDDDTLFEPERQHRVKKRLVRDPETGELIAEKRRKRSRQRPDWEEDPGRYMGEVFEDAMGFTEEDFLFADDDEPESADEPEMADELESADEPVTADEPETADEPATVDEPETADEPETEENS